MSSAARDRWSDGGDLRLARRIVIMWVIFAVVAWAGAALASFAWWVAQAGNYQDNWRGFNADDGFPWIFVIVCVVAGVCCLPVALTQRARVRHLEQGSQNG
jgi:uncharacterized membrane protein YdjX (TVP38/TMEM64 family)